MPIEPPVIILADLQHVSFTAKDADGNVIDARWSIAPALGSMDAGIYTAPPNITQPQDVSITATPTASGPAMKAVVTKLNVAEGHPARCALSRSGSGISRDLRVGPVRSGEDCLPCKIVPCVS